MSPADFRAVSTCPRCGHIAYHWIAEPPEPPEITGWEESEIRDYSGETVMVQRLPTYAPGGDVRARHINTSNSSVMRTCRQCEHVWGEH